MLDPLHKFDRMAARLKLRDSHGSRRPIPSAGFSLHISHDRDGEFFNVHLLPRPRAEG